MSLSHRAKVHGVLDDLRVVGNAHSLRVNRLSKGQGLRLVEERVDYLRHLLQPIA